MHTFHRMTIDFPVLSPVCFIFHFKGVAFYQNIGKYMILASVPIFSLVGIERGLVQDKCFL